MLFMEYNTSRVVFFNRKEGNTMRINIRKVLFVFFSGVVLAVAGLKYETWTPVAADIATAVWSAVSTPDPDHA